MLRERVDDGHEFGLHPKQLGPGSYRATMPEVTRDGVTCMAAVSPATQVD